MSEKRALLRGAVLMGTALLISGNAGKKPAQEITTGEWAQSKDPCYPTKAKSPTVKNSGQGSSGVSFPRPTWS